MSDRTPAVGDQTLYQLTEHDAVAINQRRHAGTAHRREHLDRADGTTVHTGNAVAAGDVYPLTITKVWGDTPSSAINGQVHLDGNDLHWATSVQAGHGNGHFTYRD